MMIKLIANPDTLKVNNAIYTNTKLNLSIQVKVEEIVQVDNESNVGFILEKYRGLEEDAEEYFKSKKIILEEFISKVKFPFDNFSPDCIIVIYPNNCHRKTLLESFKNRICNSIENCEIIDFSKCFVKKDPNQSIKKIPLTKDDFEFKFTKKEPFKNILVIDDVIDKGQTLKILVDGLFDLKLVDDQTVIKMCCMYNRPKINKPKVGFMDFYKNSLKK